MNKQIPYLLLFFIAMAACRPQTAIINELPEDPADIVAAFFRFDDGRQTIHVGKLHSRRYRSVGIGSYPSVSPSGRFVAYNPEGDERFKWRGIPPIVVIEVATGKETRFNSIPKETAPWPGSMWSSDEKLITFEVHDFESNRSKAVVSMVDGSFWRGTQKEFGSRYASDFLATRSPAFAQVVKGDPSYHGWAANAVFYRPSGRAPVRLTPKNMWIAASLGNPVWIERTNEIVFPGLWHSELETSGPIEKRGSPTPTMFLIDPESKDWANASKEEWQAAAIFRAEQVSCSK